MTQILFTTTCEFFGIGHIKTPQYRPRQTHPMGNMEKVGYAPKNEIDMIDIPIKRLPMEDNAQFLLHRIIIHSGSIKTRIVNRHSLTYGNKSRNGSVK